jgi:predicted transcriptional regulator
MNRIEIIISVLEIAYGIEVWQIEILNKANITHTIFVEYVSILIQYSLINNVRHQETYLLQNNRKRLEIFDHK